MPPAGFFVEERSRGCKGGRQPERLDLDILAVAKRAGLSFMEMNEFSVQELFDYVHAFTGAKDDRPRMATQEDIDRFYAG
ncbi:hypothetical protein ACOBQJ_13140 [Pelotomaculum propionicicum]|uniref:hypothetical protein n=1 Tax=Pelotomaculum propionicicum TaxID=258475 RepID=UPI003B7F11C0